MDSPINNAVLDLCATYSAGPQSIGLNLRFNKLIVLEKVRKYYGEYVL